MLKKVGIFLDEDSYGACNYMAKSLSYAFKSLGLEVSYHRNNAGLSPIQIIKDAPDFTLSFMDVSFGGQALCDFIKIPHFTYLVDPSNCYLHLTKSAYSYLSSIDPYDVAFLKHGGFDRVFQLNLAIDPKEDAPFTEKRPYTLSFFGSCWDYEEVARSWKDLYGHDLETLMRQVCDEVLASPKSSHLDLFPRLLLHKGYDLTKIAYADMQVNIGLYIRGYERVSMLRAIKSTPVDIWGSFRPKNTWDYYLKGQDNITVHPPVSYAETLDLSAKSLIVLNSSPQFKRGLHDRVFSAPLKGALLASVETEALKSSFSKTSCLCPPNEMENFEEKIQIALQSSKREEMIQEAKRCVYQKHSWDERAKMILDRMTHFCDVVKGFECKVSA